MINKLGDLDAYKVKVADFLKREGIYFLSSFPGDPGFSWTPCECCGSKLGGERWEMEGVKASGESNGFTYDVCADCLSFMEFGSPATLAEVVK
jgi:hypothetical protein